MLRIQFQTCFNMQCNPLLSANIHKKNYWKIIKHDKFVKIKSMQVSSICIHKVLEDRWSKSPFFCRDLASTSAVEDNLLMIVQFATKMHFRSRPPLRQDAAACYVAKQFFFTDFLLQIEAIWVASIFFLLPWLPSTFLEHPGEWDITTTYIAATALKPADSEVVDFFCWVV